MRDKIVSTKDTDYYESKVVNSLIEKHTNLFALEWAPGPPIDRNRLALVSDNR